MLFLTNIISFTIFLFSSIQNIILLFMILFKKPIVLWKLCWRDYNGLRNVLFNFGFWFFEILVWNEISVFLSFLKLVLKFDGSKIEWTHTLHAVIGSLRNENVWCDAWIHNIRFHNMGVCVFQYFFVSFVILC